MDLILQLDEVMKEHAPSVYEDLQPGTSTRLTTPADLRRWFRWRNGQPSDTRRELFGIYIFVSYEYGRAELAELRSSVWKSPLNFLILSLLSRRSFYSLPLLTDAAGDGYCYDMLRRTVYYRFKGEKDLFLPSFDVFVELLCQLVTKAGTAPHRAAEIEESLLRPYFR